MSCKIFNRKTLCDFFCLKIMLDFNSFISKQNNLSDASLIKNIEEKPTCNWACKIVFKQLQRSGTFSPLLKYMYINLKLSYQTPVKKDMMRIILFRTYEYLKLCIILYIFHVLRIFYIYQTISYHSNKFKSLSSKFCKCL